MNSKLLAQKPAERGRPRWGFCRVNVEILCRLWVAYNEGHLERQDVQTWFGIHELLMRRCTLRPGRTPSFSERELEPLTACRASSVRASIRRLERAGFLSWSEYRIETKGGSAATLAALRGLPEMLSAVKNHRRTLPIPRHTVLLLARTRRPVFMATVLGQLFRCMYYRSGNCFSWGTCKASWIAEAFGVDVRNVKAARVELESTGWLRQLESQHWHRQRCGGTFVISLVWSGGGIPPRRVSPPRKRLSTAKSPPPDSYRNLPLEVNHQNRLRARVAGVQGQGRKREGEPQLLHVLPADLLDPQRTAELFRQAIKVGLVKQDVMAERLWFFAVAERAKRRAENPGGYFVSVLKQRRWPEMSICDEERARRELIRMPEFFFGNVSKVTPPRVCHPVEPKLKHRPTERAGIRELIRRSLASVSEP